MSPLRGSIVVRCALALALLTIGACSMFGENRLEGIRRSGELVVVTRNGPTAYYEGPDGPAGPEYDLVKAFADRIGVKLRVVVAERFSDILPAVAAGEADVAAAGLTVTAAREAQVRFAPPYQEIREQVVYRVGTSPPANVPALIGRHLQVVAGTSYVERLEQLRLEHPKLKWEEIEDIETEELLLQVHQGLLEVTLADSNIVALARQFLPELKVAFEFPESRQIAWALARDDDESLVREARRFFDELRRSGQLASILDRYYGAHIRFNPINIAAYLERIETVLPAYEELFRRAGQAHNLDWMLLAAMAYQESYWDPRSVSPTGVRGIMMLTELTASSLGVKDRLDPEQSILGGARYLRELIDRLPSTIPEPDRTWFGLAAYNIGFSHLEDARAITQQQRADPNRWDAVKDRLPLLARQAWYRRASHGYARGYETVQFVNRIRTYYDTLRKLEARERGKDKSDALRIRIPTI